MRRASGLLGVLLYFLLNAPFLVAQPLSCNQCTSSDVKVQQVYIAGADGCTAGSPTTASICFKFDVTSQTRYGFYFAFQYTVNGMAFSYTQCFSEALSQGSFTKCFPITYTCGAQVVLTSVLMAWGNQQQDLTTFCNSSNLTCNRFNPKCYSSGTNLPVVQPPLQSTGFTATPSCVTPNTFQTYSFSGNASGGVAPYTFDWDLDGNGTFETLNQQNPTHTYASAGTYTVQMRVRDSKTPAGEVIKTSSITVGPCTLPVRLSRFSTTALDGKAALSWETASEINNSYFQIERSSDGKAFEAVGRVNGHGTTQTVSQYTFLDVRPAAGINYYRLKQTDNDGRFEYSPVRSVVIRQNGEIRILQNPVKETLTVGGLEEGAAVQVLDVRGVRRYHGTAPSAQLTIDARPWNDGVYLLRVVDRYGRKTIRFMVQH